MNNAAGHTWRRNHQSEYWLCWIQIGEPFRAKCLAVVDDYGNLIILGDCF